MEQKRERFAEASPASAPAPRPRRGARAGRESPSRRRRADESRRAGAHRRERSGRSPRLATRTAERGVCDGRPERAAVTVTAPPEERRAQRTRGTVSGFVLGCFWRVFFASVSHDVGAR